MTDAANPVGRFAALRNKDSRPYLFFAGLSMMGDNIEHVITYWALWQTFHSPLLVGFELISHWVPYLLFSVYFGSLAERYDCRRLIQIAQGLFIFVSLSWGVLFITGTLQIWEASILLVLHGMAGALWGPSEQLMLHDFVDRKDLVSAVRLNATFKNLGILCGPVVGAALLLGLGPAAGILVNAVIYVPMTILMVRTRFTGHTREESDVPSRVRVTLRDSIRVVRNIRANHRWVSVLWLAGLTAITVGASLQVSMPTFASQLTAGNSGLAYGALLFASGVGGVLGGVLLEATGVLKPTVRSALISTMVFALAILFFAMTHVFVAAIVALVVAGVASIASSSVSQSIVQLEAPPGERGRLYGVYGMFASGLRAGGGITLGVLGANLGIPSAVEWCAMALAVGVIVVGIYGRTKGRKLTSAAGSPSPS